jgi:hypothetical protein
MVILHFLLKTECPYCIKHSNDYLEKAASLPDVIQVFIKPDDEKDILQWANKLKLAKIENSQFIKMQIPQLQTCTMCLLDTFFTDNQYTTLL